MAFHFMPFCYRTSSVTFFLLQLSVICRRFFLLLILFCKGCIRFINKHTLRQESNTACTVLWRERHSFVSASFIPKARQKTGSVNRLMGTSVVVLLKISRSISGVDINALLSESEIPQAVKLFPTSLFFLVVKGLLRLSSWYPEKDILFRRSNQNMYIKFQNKMI